jgi:hypothetical protein
VHCQAQARCLAGCTFTRQAVLWNNACHHRFGQHCCACAAVLAQAPGIPAVKTSTYPHIRPVVLGVCTDEENRHLRSTRNPAQLTWRWLGNAACWQGTPCSCLVVQPARLNPANSCNNQGEEASVTLESDTCSLSLVCGNTMCLVSCTVPDAATTARRTSGLSTSCSCVAGLAGGRAGTAAPGAHLQQMTHDAAMMPKHHCLCSAWC